MAPSPAGARRPRRSSGRSCRRSTASDVACSGLSTRVESLRSRSMIDASTSSMCPPISATRRSARTRGDAVMYSFSAAFGNTTEPMSRPSTTPPPRSATHSRWRRTSSARTRLLAATALTAEVTSRPRISTVASMPSTVTPWSPTTRSSPSDTSATSSASDGSSPRRSAANVTARYIAPVSRYSSPSRSARARPTVLFPAPAGPSIAITTGALSVAASAAARVTRTPRAADLRRTRRCSARRRPLVRGIRRRWRHRRTCTTIAARRRSGR